LDKEIVRFFTVGRTGTGKSYLSNKLLGRQLFKESAGIFSETSTPQKGIREIEGRDNYPYNLVLEVIDTPGTADNRI